MGDHVLADARGYGRDHPLACLELLNRAREREGAPPLPSAPADKHRSAERLLVYVNHGRWVVDCPCGSAQLACRSDRRFWCVDCSNAWALGKWVAVDWPADEADIEGLLAQRPDVKTRNWHPTEDAMTLVAENVAHGLGA